MIGDAVLYAATQVTGQATDKIVRTAVWWAMAAVMFILALTFSVIGLYHYLLPSLGPVTSALVIAIGALLAMIAFAFVPTIIAAIERATVSAKPVEDVIANTVDAEARGAVDYFGAVRVLASAFVLGVSVARSIKER